MIRISSIQSQFSIYFSPKRNSPAQSAALVCKFSSTVPDLRIQPISGWRRKAILCSIFKHSDHLVRYDVPPIQSSRSFASYRSFVAIGIWRSSVAISDALGKVRVERKRGVREKKRAVLAVLAGTGRYSFLSHVIWLS